MPTRLLLALAILAVVSVGHAPAQRKKSSDVVKATAKADKPADDGKQVVTITLDIEKPWYLFANPVGNKDFEDLAIQVKVSGKQKPESVDVEYPAGEVQKNEQVGDYSIYKGTVTIKATVQRARGDTGPLDVAVQLQAYGPPCSLRPETIKLKVQ